MNNFEEESMDFSRFKWFLPAPREAKFAISIPNEKCFNLNQKLYAEISKRIAVGVSTDGKTLCIKEDEQGYKVPKSGSIKDGVLVGDIKNRGIRLPARYFVEKKSDCWIATLGPYASPSSVPKKFPKKPRKKGLKDMLPPEGPIS
jgi:hypothetical protein